MNGVSLMPPTASAVAAQTDTLFYALLAVSTVMVALVLALIVIFSARYRRGSPAPRGPLPAWTQREFEIGWTVATLFAFLFFFWWAGSNALSSLLPPKHAMEIHVVAKQWMWKAQHPNGVREINALHVPVDEPVRLVLISQDVIHSFFVPALRLKRDMLPGRYVETGFEADKPGVYHLLCTQFCGAEHSRMEGELVVMSKADFARWLAAQPEGDSLAAQGRALFSSLGCAGCHTPGGPVHAPDLAGVFGRTVPLAAGGFATVDAAFVRDMILDPKSHAPAGYDPIMPSFKGGVDDGQVLALTAFIRSLSPSGATP